MRQFPRYVLTRTAGTLPLGAPALARHDLPPDIAPALLGVVALVAMFWAVVYVLTVIATRLLRPRKRNPPPPLVATVVQSEDR